MFQSIHVSAGYSAIKMNSAGPLDLSKKNKGEVSALLKMGNVFRAPFGGFIEAENVVGLRKVKLIDIKYLCTDADAEVIEIDSCCFSSWRWSGARALTISKAN